MVHAFTLIATLTSPQRKRPSLKIISLFQPVNEQRTIGAYKTPFSIVKGHETWSLLRIVGICFSLVSVLLIYFDRASYLYATIWNIRNAPLRENRKKKKKKDRCHIAPLPPHNGHFHLSPMWPLLRSSTVLRFPSAWYPKKPPKREPSLEAFKFNNVKRRQLKKMASKSKYRESLIETISKLISLIEWPSKLFGTIVLNSSYAD